MLNSNITSFYDDKIAWLRFPDFNPPDFCGVYRYILDINKN
jgi:hypothetical protein